MFIICSSVRMTCELKYITILFIYPMTDILLKLKPITIHKQIIKFVQVNHNYYNKSRKGSLNLVIGPNNRTILIWDNWLYINTAGNDSSGQLPWYHVSTNNNGRKLQFNLHWKDFYSFGIYLLQRIVWPLGSMHISVIRMDLYLQLLYFPDKYIF